MSIEQFDFTKLKKAAESANQDKWFSEGSDTDDDECDPYIFTKIDPGKVGGRTNAVHVLFESDWGTTQDAAFIALANPATIMALLAELATLRSLAPTWESRGRGTTHYEGCWKDHRLCAMDEIERLHDKR